MSKTSSVRRLKKRIIHAFRDQFLTHRSKLLTKQLSAYVVAKAFQQILADEGPKE
jgi:hypothetical protein